MRSRGHLTVDATLETRQYLVDLRVNAGRLSAREGLQRNERGRITLEQPRFGFRRRNYWLPNVANTLKIQLVPNRYSLT